MDKTELVRADMTAIHNSPQSSSKHVSGNISLDRHGPVKNACQACRSRHLKCDAELPVCSRCRKEGQICEFVRSRRGRATDHLHPLKKRKVDPVGSDFGATAASPKTDDQCEPYSSQQYMYSDGDWLQSLATFDSPRDLESNIDLSVPQNLEHRSLDLVCLGEQQLPVVPRIGLGEKNFSMYTYETIFYSYFWPAHSFLPPHSYLESHTQDPRASFLLPAVRYVGSLYAPHEFSQMETEPAPHPLMQHFPRNGFTVQAFLLLSIAFHMNGDPLFAQEVLNVAIQIALEIGLNERTFAVANGTGVQIIEESWRRTWWELYIVDVMFAALNQRTTCQLQDIPHDVPLPCEEATFKQETVLPESRTLRDFDSRFFSEEGVHYSSFAYRVVAARGLSKIIALTQKDVFQDTQSFSKAELVLENLMLHLPKTKHDIVGNDGAVDEMLFQVHMMLQATIYLHRPRSNLTMSESVWILACVPRETIIPQNSVMHHTKKTVNAADAISRMITTPSPLLKHTPFFTCAVALATIVHLATHSLGLQQHSEAIVEQQIRMGVGALKKLGEAWGMARNALTLVKGAATEMLEIQARPPTGCADLESGDAQYQQQLQEIPCQNASENGYGGVSLDEGMFVDASLIDPDAPVASTKIQK